MHVVFHAAEKAAMQCVYFIVQHPWALYSSVWQSQYYFIRFQSIKFLAYVLIIKCFWYYAYHATYKCCVFYNLHWFFSVCNGRYLWNCVTLLGAHCGTRKGEGNFSGYKRDGQADIVRIICTTFPYVYLVKMWLLTYHAWKHFLDKSTSLSIYSVILLLLSQIDPCVITECNTMHCNKRCNVCCIIYFLNLAN